MLHDPDYPYGGRYMICIERKKESTIEQYIEYGKNPFVYNDLDEAIQVAEELNRKHPQRKFVILESNPLKQIWPETKVIFQPI